MSNETIDDALLKPGVFTWYKDINRKQWLALAAAFLGWTLDAMDLLFYVYALPKIRDTWALTDQHAALLFGVTLGSSALGGVLFWYHYGLYWESKSAYIFYSYVLCIYRSKRACS
ncbi:MAG: hypothetical protein ACREOW_03500 [Thermodesulfobacteriota bacterium]